MTESTRTFSVPADGKVPKPHNPAKPAPSPEEIAAVQKRRRAQAEELAAKDAGVFAAAEEEGRAQPREAIDFIEVELPNGRMVQYGPQPNVSRIMRAAMILGDQSSNMMLDQIVKVALAVRAIDGQAVRDIGTLVQAQAIANKLGDEGLTMLVALDNEYWPGVRRGDMPAVKKTFREP